MTRWPALLRRMFAVVGLSVAISSAAVAVSAQGGRWSGLLDITNHFTPLWGTSGLVGALLCGVAGRGIWRRRGVALGLVATILSLAGMAPEVVAGGREPEAASGRTLTLVQFNLWKRNIAPSRTLAWIVAQNADVVLTEEAIGKADLINRGLRKVYPYWSSDNLPATGSVMIYSRFPIMTRGSGNGPPSAWAVIDWYGQPVTVAAIHAYWPYPPGPQQWQLKRLARFVRGQTAETMILAGDFNAAPWSFSLKLFDRNITLTRRTHGIATWPAASVSPLQIPTLFPVLPLDQVYAGPHWRTIDVRRGPRLGSDHYPVVVVLGPVAKRPPRPGR